MALFGGRICENHVLTNDEKEESEEFLPPLYRSFIHRLQDNNSKGIAFQSQQKIVPKSTSSRL